MEPSTSRDYRGELEQEQPKRRGSLGGMDCKVIASSVKKTEAEFRFSIDMENLLDGSEFMQTANVFHSDEFQAPSSSQQQLQQQQPQSSSPSSRPEGRKSPSSSGNKKGRVRRSSCTARLERGSPLLMRGEGEEDPDESVLEAMQKGIQMAARSSMQADVDDTQDAIRALLQQLTAEDLLDDDDDDDDILDDDDGYLSPGFPHQSSNEALEEAEPEEPVITKPTKKKKKKSSSSPKKGRDDDVNGGKRRKSTSVKKKKERRASRDALDLFPTGEDELVSDRPKSSRSRRRSSFQDLAKPDSLSKSERGASSGSKTSRRKSHQDNSSSKRGDPASNTKSLSEHRRSLAPPPLVEPTPAATTTTTKQRRKSSNNNKLMMMKDNIKFDPSGWGDEERTAATVTSSSLESNGSIRQTPPQRGQNQRLSKRTSFSSSISSEQELVVQKSGLKW